MLSGDFVIGCLLCLFIGAAAMWALVQGVLKAQRILAAETLEQRMDEQAALHALALEAVRRGTDVVHADENAWQILDKLRHAQPVGVLPLARTRMVRPSARLVAS